MNLGNFLAFTVITLFVITFPIARKHPPLAIVFLTSLGVSVFYACAITFYLFIVCYNDSCTGWFGWVPILLLIVMPIVIFVASFVYRARNLYISSKKSTRQFIREDVLSIIIALCISLMIGTIAGITTNRDDLVYTPPEPRPSATDQLQEKLNLNEIDSKRLELLTGMVYQNRQFARDKGRLFANAAEANNYINDPRRQFNRVNGARNPETKQTYTYTDTLPDVDQIMYKLSTSCSDDSRALGNEVETDSGAFIFLTRASDGLYICVSNADI